MDRAELIVKPERFWRGQPRWDKPVAVIDLDAGNPWPDPIALPACPLIGIGSRDAPGAELLDALIEPPASLDAVLARIEATPLAAATLVQLLRIVPHLPAEAALTAESFAYAALQGSAEHRSWQFRTLAERGHPGAPGAVLIDRTDNRLDVVMDRPAAGNAVDRGMRDQLCEAFELAELDPTIERVLLRATGRAFCLGADLAEFGTTADPATANAIRAATLPARLSVRIANRLEARVQGACVGAGLELAAFAGKIIATGDAWFQLPELAMGILPGAGGCVSVTRRIGRQRAALMILSGKRVSAARALDWGLIDSVVDDLS